MSAKESLDASVGCQKQAGIGHLWTFDEKRMSNPTGRRSGRWFLSFESAENWFQEEQKAKESSTR
jgi:hypothetical protein